MSRIRLIFDRSFIVINPPVRYFVTKYTFEIEHRITFPVKSESSYRAISRESIIDNRQVDFQQCFNEPSKLIIGHNATP